jgi:Spy/CpxP family protein refolding chaperone
MPDGEVARSGSPLGRGFGRGRGLGMPEAPRQFAERLARDLELTDDQRRQVEGILERQVPQMRAASDSVRALIERPLEETRVQLLSILSPEQKKKFLKLLEAEPRPVMVRRF